MANISSITLGNKTLQIQKKNIPSKSAIDKSKFVLHGNAIISNDGIASGFNASTNSWIDLASGANADLNNRCWFVQIKAKHPTWDLSDNTYCLFTLMSWRYANNSIANETTHVFYGYGASDKTGIQFQFNDVSGNAQKRLPSKLTNNEWAYFQFENTGTIVVATIRDKDYNILGQWETYSVARTGYLTHQDDIKVSFGVGLTYGANSTTIASNHYAFTNGQIDLKETFVETMNSSYRNTFKFNYD